MHPPEQKSVNRVPDLIGAKTKRTVTGTLVVITLMYLFATGFTGASPAELWEGLPDLWRLMQDFFPPNWGYLPEAFSRLLETVQMAIIATTVAAFAALPLALFGAANLAPSRSLSVSIKQGMNLLRTIPDLLLAVIFIGMFGVGVFSGVMALIIVSTGILVKLTSEAAEAIQPGPVEAVRASGANLIQVMAYGVVPQLLPQFTSYALYVFEINVRASLVLGFVGAGGIGQLLQRSISFFRYDDALMVVLVIFAAVVVIDRISLTVRKGLI
ncbi:phosphonate ABC transporter, permease protein PhnE [Salisediminibacterium selenitireducens]|uniref:Phosphonate ABC transporter, inner membrane subunit n=1 Tax=Bacillus selenitireducens (strain ATCC 700615 / DSM 15326 / MLS10) TaxID=439292 RepID=D6XXQ1_BACIE|nr:phosphonate ABC transporter, permease protein PhnE [Salisediminibacterium selenitireducens]ADI00094.1 phosphonate ABC transporter, inner membrane subunit [[Bacillus] selenitireducens MLS10]